MRRRSQLSSALAHSIATGLGSGCAPFLPGTFGSAAAATIWLGITALCSAPLRTVAMLLLTVTLLVGVPAVATVLRGERSTDPGFVVIDEWAGMFLVFALLPVTTRMEVFLAFLLFRLFDITKPGPVRWAESFPGAWGVMADDLVAGVMAAAGLFALQYAGIPWMQP
ncbi:MAG: phosphatidylglycerophosphatase A [Proteobacteria bacterium]|nr:phosphatidylglycerophosphatase A [Pseudomonadota bacterium]